ncbi:MAG: DNA damage-inducible protein D [Mycoplasma sp.]|nr:DNA damage-inducible protein D [Mycoplasma sp.]
MNELEKINETIFESIKHVDDDGNQYWYARELQYILGYNQWRSINDLIKRAKVACKESDNNIHDHFAVQRKMVDIGSNTQREVLDYKLSRYACYLIVMNGNPKKEIIALAQTYFAIQTRKQELLEEEYNILTEDEKRFYQRDLTKKGNYSLNQTAKKAGVKNFDKFHNAGYKGLYNGETANDIAKRKGLRYREDILDNMGSVELGANIFRITQTEALLEKQEAPNEIIATNTHYKVGKTVRKAIEDLGGTMPEDLPTPDKSLKELEKENKDLIIKK